MNSLISNKSLQLLIFTGKSSNFLIIILQLQIYFHTTLTVCGVAGTCRQLRIRWKQLCIRFEIFIHYRSVEEEYFLLRVRKKFFSFHVFNYMFAKTVLKSFSYIFQKWNVETNHLKIVFRCVYQSLVAVNISLPCFNALISCKSYFFNSVKLIVTRVLVLTYIQFRFYWNGNFQKMFNPIRTFM